MEIEKKYFVVVRCFTYNHAAYITDALNGFCMQQTTFPFICVIVDDASTDGEQDVIKAYLENHFDLSKEAGFRQWETEDAFWTIARHGKNENCLFVVSYLKKNLNRSDLKYKKLELIRPWEGDSKYIALCEGDDYWISSLKLQKQTDFLETHPDFTMCFHGSDVKNESDREVMIHCDTIETREYFPADVFPEWVPHLSSFCFRSWINERFEMKHSEWLESGDTATVLKCMHLGRVWGMKEHMSVYRMNNFSSMSQPNNVKAIGRYVQHLKCFLLNFPKIDKEYCYMEICEYDYKRFKQNDGDRNRFYFLWDAIRTSPRYMLKKEKQRVKVKLKSLLIKDLKKTYR